VQPQPRLAAAPPSVADIPPALDPTPEDFDVLLADLIDPPSGPTPVQYAAPSAYSAPPSYTAPPGYGAYPGSYWGPPQLPPAWAYPPMQSWYPGVGAGAPIPAPPSPVTNIPRKTGTLQTDPSAKLHAAIVQDKQSERSISYVIRQFGPRMSPHELRQYETALSEVVAERLLLEDVVTTSHPSAHAVATAHLPVAAALPVVVTAAPPVASTTAPPAATHVSPLKTIPRKTGALPSDPVEKLRAALTQDQQSEKMIRWTIDQFGARLPRHVVMQYEDSLSEVTAERLLLEDVLAMREEPEPAPVRLARASSRKQVTVQHRSAAVSAQPAPAPRPAPSAPEEKRPKRVCRAPKRG
jgi:predicted component of type VI protein secretion system